MYPLALVSGAPHKAYIFRFNTPTNNTFPASGTHTCLILRGYPPSSHTFLAKSQGLTPPYVHTLSEIRIHPPTPEPVGVGDCIIHWSPFTWQHSTFNIHHSSFIIHHPSSIIHHSWPITHLPSSIIHHHHHHHHHHHRRRRYHHHHLHHHLHDGLHHHLIIVSSLIIHQSSFFFIVRHHSSLCLLLCHFLLFAFRLCSRLMFVWFCADGLALPPSVTSWFCWSSSLVCLFRVCLVVLLFCCPAGGACSQCCSFPWSLGLLGRICCPSLPNESVDPHAVVPFVPLSRYRWTVVVQFPFAVARFPFPVGESQLWENLCFSPSFLPLLCKILTTFSQEMMVKDEKSRWNCNFEACKGCSV